MPRAGTGLDAAAFPLRMTIDANEQLRTILRASLRPAPAPAALCQRISALLAREVVLAATGREPPRLRLR